MRGKRGYKNRGKWYSRRTSTERKAGAPCIMPENSINLIEEL